MIGEDHRGSARRNASLAQLERDAALHRVGRTRRWMIFAAAGLTAAFAAVVSAIAPGKSLGARAVVVGPRSAPTARPVTASTLMPPLATAGDLGLQGPTQAPQSVPSQSQASADQAAAQQAQADQQAQAAAQAQQSQAAAQPAPAQAPAPAVSGGS